MTLGLAFWIVMLVWLIFGVWSSVTARAWPFPDAIHFILFFLLGWAAFGPPIHG